MGAKEIALRDILEEEHLGGISLNLPTSLLFNEEEFFDHYRDTIVDRERAHTIYSLKKKGQYNITHRKPRR